MSRRFWTVAVPLALLLDALIAYGVWLAVR
jgi:hypothetical protein